MTEETKAKFKQFIDSAPVQESIRTINVEFYGGGDSGEITDIDIEYKEGYDGDKLPKEGEDNLEELIYIYLSEEHGGWEINDGSSGKVIIDVENRLVRDEFNEYYQESNYSENECEL